MSLRFSIFSRYFFETVKQILADSLLQFASYDELRWRFILLNITVLVGLSASHSEDNTIFPKPKSASTLKKEVQTTTECRILPRR
jgi:hypothetical protein